VSHEPTEVQADVVVQGRAADLLLALTQRLAADDPRLTVSGDAGLFRHWRDNTRF
jgi:predicted lipid carrier protein YhbT